MDSGVKSGDVETSQSSSAGTVGVKTDTATSIPSSSHPSIFDTSRPFYTLKEECSLKRDTFRRFRDRF